MKENLVSYILLAVSLIIPAIFITMLFNIVIGSIPAITQIGAGLLDSQAEWWPVANTPSFGILPMVIGTLFVSFLAVAMAAPIGLLCAVFLNFYVDKRLSKLITAFIDMLAGVPSVVFGFIGMIVVVGNFERIFNMSAGDSVLAAAIVLAVMLLPYIVSSYSESIEIAKNKYGALALALGTPKEYSVMKIIIPTTKRSAAAAITAAYGRAVGETMAVLMIIGNAPIFPRLLGRGQTIPALTVTEFGSAAIGSLHLSAIFAANLILIMLLCLIFIIAHFLKRGFIHNED